MKMSIVEKPGRLIKAFQSITSNRCDSGTVNYKKKIYFDSTNSEHGAWACQMKCSWTGIILGTESILVALGKESALETSES